MRFPSSLVGGAGGYVVALVKDSEVTGGAWRPAGGAGQVLGLPTVRHQQVDEAGGSFLMAVPFKGVGVSAGTDVLLSGPPGRETYAQPQPWESLVAGEHGPDAVLNLSLEVPKTLIDAAESATIALIPRSQLDGLNWRQTDGASYPEAPEVLEGMVGNRTEAGPNIAIVTVPQTPESTPESMNRAAVQVLIRDSNRVVGILGYTEKAMGEAWVKSALDAHGVSREQALSALDQYLDWAEKGAVPADVMGTREGRRTVGVGRLLLAGAEIAAERAKFGDKDVDTVVRNKFSFETPRSTLEMLEADPALRLAFDPVDRLENAHALGDKTTLRTLEEFLLAAPPPKDSGVFLIGPSGARAIDPGADLPALLTARNRALYRNPEATGMEAYVEILSPTPRAALEDVTLGDVRKVVQGDLESSEKKMGRSNLARWGLLGATAASLLLPGGIFVAGAVGIGTVLAFGYHARAKLENQENRAMDGALAGAIEAASKGDRELADWMATHATRREPDS